MSVCVVVESVVEATINEATLTESERVREGRGEVRAQKTSDIR